MDSLTSWFSSSKDYYEENVKVVSEFAHTDSEKAMIKSKNGLLVRGDGMMRPYYWAQGTTLEGTVKILAETFEKTIQDVSANLREAQKAVLSPEEILHSKALQNLEDYLLKEYGLLAGIEKINNIYQERYKQTPSHEGLQELQNLYDKSAEQVKSDSEMAKELIRDILTIMKKSDEAVVPEVKGEPARSFEDYCTIFRISPTQASHYTEVGKKLMQGILEGTHHPSKDLKTSEEELAALSWFLMSCAIQKGEGHEEGAFIIEDIHQYLYNFLLNSPGTKTRASSHFVGRSPKDNSLSTVAFSSAKHHGVDVIKGLPANKRTILFEMIDNPAFIEGLSKVLFFKLENYSPFLTTGYGYDALMHGYELIQAQYNKRFKPGSDDDPSMRKERVPAALLKDFATIIQFIKDNINDFGGREALEILDPNQELLDLDKANKNAKLWGVMYMHQFLVKMKELPIYPNDFDNLIKPLEDEFGTLEYPEKRTGREVYLTIEELYGKASGASPEET